MKMSVMGRLMIAVAIIVTCQSLLVAGQIYNVASDFSLAGNPNGVWSYGTTGTTLNGALTLFTNSTTTHTTNPNVHAWTGAEPAFGNNYAFVGKNTAATIQDGGGGFVPLLPGQLYMHPSPTGAVSVSRFTAPMTGLYQIDASFEGRDVRGTTTNVHILLNSVPIFDGVVNGFDLGSISTFSSLQSLLAGDRLDFSVGYGSNMTFLQDSTALAATISAVPEPSALALSGLCMTGLIAFRRKRLGIAGA